jgi:hypothetical protein
MAKEKLKRPRPKAAPQPISEAEEMRSIKQVAAKRRAKQATSKKTGSAVAGAGNRGGKGATGKLASRTSKDKRDRDARRAGTPLAPKSKSTSTRGTGPNKSVNSRGSTKNTKKKKKNPVKRKPVTAPAPTPTPTEEIVRTERKGVPVTGTPFSSNIVEQQRDILYSFLAMSGTELFQYTNSRTIDGMFDNVSIISVLSSRRKQYTPNTIIETGIPLIKHVWVEGGILYVEVEGASEGRRVVLEFYKPPKITKVESVDYV